MRIQTQVSFIYLFKGRRRRRGSTRRRGSGRGEGGARGEITKQKQAENEIKGINMEKIH